MSISLSIGSSGTVSLTNLSDLASALEPTALSLLRGFDGHLDDQLSSVPAALQTSEIQYASGNRSWNVGDFGFTLCGGVTGKLSIVSSGNLFSYTDAFATTISAGLTINKNSDATKQIAVPGSSIYVCIALDLTIRGGVTASATSGIYGSSLTASNSDAFTVKFCKKCAPTDSVQAALEAAFSDFVLPLHSATLNKLKPGDYLYHNFNAKLQLGLGASIGYDKVLYAGQAKVAIPDTANAVDLNASVKPELQLGAKLAFGFTYAGTFEALLWTAPTATGDGPAQTGHLHLFRSQTQDPSLDLTLGLTFSANANVNAVLNMGNQLKSFFTGLLPAPLAQAFSNSVWPKASDEVGKYVNEANAKICSWLKPLNNAQASLDLAIQQTKSSCLLLDYSFDLAAAAYQTAWSLAYHGDFADALAVPNGGVGIATGSGLEKLYDDKTSVTLNLFGKLNAQWTTDVINNSSLIYAGNGIFHLIADEGIELLSKVNGVKKEIEVYFAAELDLPSTTLPRASVNLHFILQATNNASFGNSIARFITELTTGQDAANLAKSVSALAGQPGTTQMLHIVLGSAAYGSLNYSTIAPHGPYDQTVDKANYAAFANACSDLVTNMPDGLSFNSLPYSSWGSWNIACNNDWPAPNGAVPDRRQAGNVGGAQAAACLEQLFGEGSETVLIGYALNVESTFMNLCQDLSTLAALTLAGSVEAQWVQLVSRLKYIVANDLSRDFVVPTALALTRLCAGAQPALVSGPVSGLAPANSIAITLTYA